MVTGTLAKVGGNALQRHATNKDSKKAAAAELLAADPSAAAEVARQKKQTRLGIAAMATTVALIITGGVAYEVHKAYGEAGKIGDKIAGAIDRSTQLAVAAQAGVVLKEAAPTQNQQVLKGVAAATPSITTESRFLSFGIPFDGGTTTLTQQAGVADVVLAGGMSFSNTTANGIPSMRVNVAMDKVVAEELDPTYSAFGGGDRILKRGVDVILGNSGDNARAKEDINLGNNSIERSASAMNPMLAAAIALDVRSLLSTADKLHPENAAIDQQLENNMTIAFVSQPATLMTANHQPPSSFAEANPSGIDLVCAQDIGVQVPAAFTKDTLAHDMGTSAKNVNFSVGNTAATVTQQTVQEMVTVAETPGYHLLNTPCY